MPQFDVLSYGTIGLDRIYDVPHWPHADLSTHSNSPVEHLGGKASNTAVILGSWGLNVALAGTILGTDVVGQRVRGLLESRKGIDLTLLEAQESISSMHCLIFVNANGERAIVGVNADNQLCKQLSRDIILGAGCLTLDLYGGSERVEAARLAFELGRSVVIGDLRRLDHPVIQYSTITISSAPELRLEYPGIDLHKFVSEIVSRGPMCSIVTDGPNPAIMATTDSQIRSFRPPTVDVIDTTGAGDALRAGLVYGLVKGKSMTDCFLIGLASGSLAVTERGACSYPASLEAVTTMATQIAEEPIV